MADPETQIVLEMEGLESEDGHVKLQDLLNQLQALKSALDSVDKQYGATKQASLYYRIVDMSHASPIRITLEPVAKESAQLRSQVDVIARHHRFFRELEAVHENRQSETMEIETLDAFKRLVEHKDTAFAKATIYNGSARVELDDRFQSNISKLLQGTFYSYGTMSGRLDALNIHAHPAFWIYPTHGPQRVYCTIPASKKTKMLDCVDKLVRVRGKKVFRPLSRFPYRIEVVDFEPIDPAEDVEGFVKMRGTLVNDESSMDSIERLRDEWE